MRRNASTECIVRRIVMPNLVIVPMGFAQGVTKRPARRDFPGFDITQRLA